MNIDDDLKSAYEDGYEKGFADGFKAGQRDIQPEAKSPKWVAEDRYIKNKFAVFPHCPRCNKEITTGQCYCMICGQHIDWSEDEG